MKRVCLAICLTLGLAFPADAQDKTFTLTAPQELIDSGVLKYILPRFSLKTGVRITLTEENAAASFGDDGVVAFSGLDRIWRFEAGDDPDAQRFADWLRSDVGRRAVDAFVVDGVALFSSTVDETVEVAEVSFDGDAALGEVTSLTHCGRCHVVNDKNRMNAIGSTPSFAVLRTLEDWEYRFQAFYVLNPHPSFTQIADVTEPFDASRPSPIYPLELTLGDLENILAFVQTITPADLGAPVQTMKP